MALKVLCPPREREIVIDRTCARCGCEYEWGVHVAAFGSAVGLTPDQLEETARSLFAALIHAESDGVALVPSASYGINIAATNLPLSKSQRILLLEEEFPSNVYAWYELAKRREAIVEMVKRPQEGNWTQALLEQIHEQTGIVAIPHCYWTDGCLIDLPQVSKRVREVGAALVIDATQSVGAYPLDIAEIQPDFVVTATYKWLLGPYSLGFVYIAPQHRQGTPLEFPWSGREGSEDFAQLVNYRHSYQPGARRFDMGERSNFISPPMMNLALQQLLEWEVPRIHETLRDLTTLIEGRARALGFQTVTSEYRAGHIIGLHHPSGLPGQLTASLAKDQVFVSVRGNSIRISPHLYNTPEDIDRLFTSLKQLV